jgi:indole-3-glycerol phosphate synthase
MRKNRGEERMPLTQPQRDLRRRQRRRRKLRELKRKLQEAKDAQTRQRLIAKIRKISPWVEIPE